MTILEPTTLITDYVLAVFSIVFGLKLLSVRTHRGTLLWSIGFLALAAAGLTGGSIHGFHHMMSDGSYRSLWNLTLLLIGISAGFMISAALFGSLSRGARHTQWLSAGLILSIVGFVILQTHVTIDSNFNHNDLYHCVQIVALYCFFTGAKMTA